MKKILLIGSDGYIGSRLYLEIKSKYDISKVDIGWFADCKSLDMKNIGDISMYDCIILLAGHSSVKMCDDMESSYYNNVDNFVKLLGKINKTQKFIYASSSSVYGNTGDKIVDETHNNFEPNNYYDLTKKIIDMYAQLSEVEYYGLRFGTVNGYSPIFRNDIMINAMMFNALKDGNINLYVKDIKRPILGIKDLVKAICTIIDNGTFDKRGLYNLCSFNSTPEEIAYKISSKFNIKVKELEVKDVNKITNVKLQANSYNFSINCNKFVANFNFEFKETIDSIVQEIVDNFDTMIKNNRINKKIYGK